MMSSTSHPIPEFRDADQYWQQPIAGDGHEIIRPKPRRPGDPHRSNGDVALRSSSREQVFCRTSPTTASKPPSRDGGGGSTPALKVPRDPTPSSRTPSRELMTSSGNNMAARTPSREKVVSTSAHPTRDVASNVGRESNHGYTEKPPVPTKSAALKGNIRELTPGPRHSPRTPIQVPLREMKGPVVVVKVDPYQPHAPPEQQEDWKEPLANDEEVPPSNNGLHSPISTDCGSLSKSSSDGDPIILRKRPPTKLKSRRRNILNFPHHLSMEELRMMQPRKQDSCGGSSSDENRSSGHASMSDDPSSSSPLGSETVTCILGVRPDIEHHHATGHPANGVRMEYVSDSRWVAEQHHRIPLKSVPEDEKMTTGSTALPPKPCNRRLAMGRSRHRGGRDELGLPLEGASGLEDIRQAIETLTLRSQGSRTSYSTSTYSSVSGSESEPAVRRLLRHSSLETINTNVTSADEFVWMDSHSRLVELQNLPWTNHDVLRVLQNGRLKDAVQRVSMETVPRLAYLLQRALVRVARETQRFVRPLGMCSKQEVLSALRVVLAPILADSCSKACLRAAAMFTVSGEQQFRQSKSSRAGLQLSVGRFHRWMCDVRLGRFVHEYAAVFLTAAIENLLEEVVLQCLPRDEGTSLTASGLENAIANNGDLWGLLQPYSHLNAGRTASGTLALPRWPSQASELGSCSGSSVQLGSAEEQSTPRTSGRTMEQSLLTTCVGSVAELSDLLSRVAQHHHRQSSSGPPSGSTVRQPITWGPSAVQTLFYFMRCSQLEHADHRTVGPVQELVYERPYVVLPPLVEWVRIAVAHTEHRHSLVVDKDDVMQAARLLLPGVDCPTRHAGYDEMMCARRQMDDVECARRFKTALAFRMLMSSRTDLVSHALQLLPSSKANTLNEQGLSLLMLSCVRGDEPMVQTLLGNGADVDTETPVSSPAIPSVNPETQHWTAITYATIHGHLGIVKLLLDKGASVEGGARLNEDKVTVTPLQLAAAAGNLEMVSLLLSRGAHPFLSTMVRDSLCYGGAAQRGCYSAIAVAAAHGQRTALHKLLSHPLHHGNKEVLSLEEILAEGANQLTSDRRAARYQVAAEDGSRANQSTTGNDIIPLVKLTKQQVKALQEAMYHSAESGHLEITLDLRNIGVPWTLHCWMHTLSTAHDLHLESVIDQLLQDFQPLWPDDCSTQFVGECLPLLFTIFRHSKNEGTSLLLADIFSSCYGKESIKTIHYECFIGGARIDPKYVNNPELSDVQFRVEGRVFYAHKIILVNASPRFKSMLTSKFCEGNPPIVQINDIRYDIFQMVMQYLYKGACENLDVDQNDVLELMAAANFFQLDGLLHFCESRCSDFVDQDSVVAMYIHAKVYNAVRLLEFCQGFFLQNMVALLTYDDSVRRLIFGKKLHNHDVLAGLLLTLQTRIKAKQTKSPGKTNG